VPRSGVIPERRFTTKGCINMCPYFDTEGMEHSMVCNHPFWKDKEPYANYIITQDNRGIGKFPKKCPL
jgi:hypothetical protein